MDSNFSYENPLPRDTPLARQHYYAHKASTAHDEHHFWQMLWFELARDYNAAVANVGAFVRWIDVHPEKAEHDARPGSSKRKS